MVSLGPQAKMSAEGTKVPRVNLPSLRVPQGERCIQSHLTGGGGTGWYLQSTLQNPWLKVPQLCEFIVNSHVG